MREQVGANYATVVVYAIKVLPDVVASNQLFTSYTHLWPRFITTRNALWNVVSVP